MSGVDGAGLREVLTAAMLHHDPTEDDCDPAGLVCSNVHHLVAELLPVLADALAAAEQRGRAEVAARVEAAIRLVSPDHITPAGARQLRAALADGED